MAGVLFLLFSRRIGSCVGGTCWFGLLGELALAVGP